MAKHHFFQLGPLALDMPPVLAHDYQYEWVEDDLTYEPDEDIPLFKSGKLNQPFRNNWFLIGRGAAILNDLDRLATLPANLIILDSGAIVPDEAQHILDLKQAHNVDFDDGEHLRDILEHDCYDGQQGLGLNPDNVSVSQSFTGDVRLDGHKTITVEGHFDDQAKPVLNWRTSTWDLYDTYFDVLPEIEVSGDVTAWFEVILISSRDRGDMQRLTLDAEHFREGLSVYTGNADQIMQVRLFAQGTGKISVGKIHVRISRNGFGELFPNGQRLVDTTDRNSELLAYFDAGDMKPPLMVYFSGYRTAEGFEANFLMQYFKSPFMIIGDPRLEGGAFYLGSDNLEQQVVDAIQEKLDALGFTHDQLVLSGLSMGTTGALYYSARLQPHAVVVGKPLVNLGNIAGNERINRPHGFPTSFDLMLNNDKSVSKAGVEEMNKRFWDRFKAGQVSDTLYVLAYMLDDDYDGTAFPDLFRYLTSTFQGIRIWHKGLVGRHNDDTPGITNWFMRQILLIYAHDFGRVAEEG